MSSYWIQFQNMIYAFVSNSFVVRCARFLFKSLSQIMKPSRLQLKRGLFWYRHIQNCTKWSTMGVHGLSLGPFVAKLRCVSFLLWKNVEKWYYGSKNHKNVILREKHLWVTYSRSYEWRQLMCGHLSWGKVKCKQGTNVPKQKCIEKR